MNPTIVGDTVSPSRSIAHTPRIGALVMDSSSGTSIWTYIIALVVAAVFGYVCARIAGRKGHSAVGYGILGFFLPLIGLIVVLVIKDRTKAVTQA
jgi:hypothetical protein